jgi:23S rRNA (cytidine1920-2'-O)/16S rRNA (cytidine1409-2'-O)-methyltransferase
MASDLKQARALIGAGQVVVNDTCSDKAGNLHDDAVDIRLKTLRRYVSRGGLKLEKALSSYQINGEGLVCIDVGASTGGFTDCLLQHGVKCVYAVDVAYGQLAWKLRQDPRVIILERCNARNLTADEIPIPLDLAVIDASFISLETLIPPLLPLFGKSIHILALIKPQFELPREMVEKGGVVRNEMYRRQAIEKITDFACHLGLTVAGTVQSPIRGPKGNKEFIISLQGTHRENHVTPSGA